jgi:hypothetical protein
MTIFAVGEADGNSEEEDNSRSPSWMTTRKTDAGAKANGSAQNDRHPSLALNIQVPLEA